MTAPLDYAPARPSPTRRWWRRLRLPLLAVALVAAVLATSAAYRHVDAYLIGREAAWWRERSERLSADERRARAIGKTRGWPLAVAREVGPHLDGALSHRSPRVRAEASSLAYEIGHAFTSPDDEHPTVPAFDDGVRDMLMGRLLADQHKYPVELATALLACRGVDLTAAAARWDALSADGREAVVYLAYKSGPQTPGGAEIMLRAVTADDAKLRRLARSIYQEWLLHLHPPTASDRDWALSYFPKMHPAWSRPPEPRPVLPPATAARATAAVALAEQREHGGVSFNWATWLAHYAALAGPEAADVLPALDAAAASAATPESRAAAASAAAAIRDENRGQP